MWLAVFGAVTRDSHLTLASVLFFAASSGWTAFRVPSHRRVITPRQASIHIIPLLAQLGIITVSRMLPETSSKPSFLAHR